jgi:hypothetical protein
MEKLCIQQDILREEHCGKKTHVVDSSETEGETSWHTAKRLSIQCYEVHAGALPDTESDCTALSVLSDGNTWSGTCIVVTEGDRHGCPIDYGRRWSGQKITLVVSQVITYQTRHSMRFLRGTHFH